MFTALFVTHIFLKKEKKKKAHPKFHGWGLGFDLKDDAPL